MTICDSLEHNSGEGNGTPLQYSCLGNLMDGGTWQAAVHGVAKSRTRLRGFTFTFHFMHWRRKWQPTPVFLPGESQGRRSLVGCRLWGRTESDTTEATQQQQQQQNTTEQLSARAHTHTHTHRNKIQILDNFPGIQGFCIVIGGCCRGFDFNYLLKCYSQFISIFSITTRDIFYYSSYNLFT